MPVTDPLRHHRIKKIIIGIIVVPIALFIILIMYGFVASIFKQSEQINSGNYSANTANPTSTPANVYTDEERLLIEGTNTQRYGSDKPQLTIVEFADFACPYCLASAPGLRELAFKYKDTVSIIFRDWPGHQNSISLALGAYCAGEQNKFWEMHDALYRNQSESFGSDKNDIATLALTLGVYNQQFQECFDSKKYLSLIQKNTADSQTLGVKGTPTWFFNDTKVEGALTKTELEQLIQRYVK